MPLVTLSLLLPLVFLETLKPLEPPLFLLDLKNLELLLHQALLEVLSPLVLPYYLELLLLLGLLEVL